MDDAVSVVILSKNDLGLRATVDSLLAERAMLGTPVELIVVDSSTDERVTSLSRRYQGSVVWVPFRNEEPALSKRSTIPQQRNLGVRQAKGGVIVFIDADCIPCSGWLSYLVGPLLNDGEHITAGPALAASAKDNMWATSKKATSENGREYIDDASSVNIGIRKEVFDRVGLFDESFLYGSDIDLTVRAVAKGYRIRFIREAAIVHEWGKPQRANDEILEMGRSSRTNL